MPTEPTVRATLLSVKKRARTSGAGAYSAAPCCNAQKASGVELRHQAHTKSLFAEQSNRTALKSASCAAQDRGGNSRTSSPRAGSAVLQYNEQQTCGADSVRDGKKSSPLLRRATVSSEPSRRTCPSRLQDMDTSTCRRSRLCQPRMQCKRSQRCRPLRHGNDIQSFAEKSTASRSQVREPPCSHKQCTPRTSSARGDSAALCY